MERKEAPIIILAGPTGSGKSALALALAEELRGAIINADSMQIYRDLAVLTARPSAAEMARAPHYLYGAIDAAEACSAGRWRALALDAIAEARGKGLLPLVTGGSGLYLHALVNGIAELPPVPAEQREASRALHRRLGGDAFRAALVARDPASTKLAAGDTQRLIRAHEVLEATGLSLSRWQERQENGAGLDAAAIVLLPPRRALYARLDERLALMLDHGAAEEVRALMARQLAPDLPAMKALGIRDIARWLDGETTREAALAAVQQATRNYAKRQYTWLRHRLVEDGKLRKLAITEQFSERLLPEIFAFIRRFLLTDKN